MFVNTTCLFCSFQGLFCMSHGLFVCVHISLLFASSFNSPEVGAVEERFCVCQQYRYFWDDKRICFFCVLQGLFLCVHTSLLYASL